MERRATAVALAIAMSLTAALSAVPVQAVEPNCTKDFDIADSELLADTRPLDPGEWETGMEDVAHDEPDQDVTVKLTSNDDELEFGIFEDVNGCDWSNNVATTACQGNVTIDTYDQGVKTNSETCRLESPDSSTREFFFVVENIEDPGDQLEYEIFVS